MTRQIFLDTETTGLSAEGGDRLVEVACLEMEQRRLTGRSLHLYVNPEREVPQEATRIHGLTDAFLADKPTFAVVATELAEFVSGAELIIHNASFDMGFLEMEMRRAELPQWRSRLHSVTDTLAMARALYPGKRNSLDALCDRLEVDRSSRAFHGALLDARLLAEVYIRLTRGQDSLLGDGSAKGNAVAHAAKGDFSAQSLVRVLPSALEREAHLDVLADIDKASGGKTVWRRFAEAASDPAVPVA